eukprot:scaffold149_cov179-Amphora_coffeaeformis.AAC.22
MTHAPVPNARSPSKSLSNPSSFFIFSSMRKEGAHLPLSLALWSKFMVSCLVRMVLNDDFLMNQDTRKPLRLPPPSDILLPYRVNCGGGRTREWCVELGRFSALKKKREKTGSSTGTRQSARPPFPEIRNEQSNDVE